MTCMLGASWCITECKGWRSESPSHRRRLEVHGEDAPHVAIRAKKNLKRFSVNLILLPASPCVSLHILLQVLRTFRIGKLSLNLLFHRLLMGGWPVESCSNDRIGGDFPSLELPPFAHIYIV